MVLQSEIFSRSPRHQLTCMLMLLLVTLTSCSSNRGPAPVRNISTDPFTEQNNRAGYYKVRKTDTLYSIAFRYGMDFRKLANINQIGKPYTIYPGQTLKLRSTLADNRSVTQSSTHTKNKTKKSKKKAIKTTKNIAAQHNKITDKSDSNNKNKALQQDTQYDQKKKVTAWLWPVKNKSQKEISSGKGKQQAIKITGNLGEPIRAAADGRVVYSGNGLVGYGNLIIIKHSRSFLSAYAHNEKLAVKEQDIVKAGQVIATMGKNGTGQVQLHFEIRYQGRPVNPMKYLP